jgi:hypothetical protein
MCACPYQKKYVCGNTLADELIVVVCVSLAPLVISEFVLIKELVGIQISIDLVFVYWTHLYKKKYIRDCDSANIALLFRYFLIFFFLFVCASESGVQIL